MKELYLFNTLGREKQKFVPLKDGEVRMYTCGPTVYERASIGNMRSYVFADILIRTLRYFGHQVKVVQNITDVGHLINDSDDGADKMEESARRTGRSAMDIAEHFTRLYKQDLAKLNIIEPSIWSPATEHIKEQIDFIVTLEQKGFTYKTDDGIYFDTGKLSDYGKLALLDIEGLREGARIEINKKKKHATDFALWKFSPTNTHRQLEWDSPWGVGFPGWHIECSAMSYKYLGFPFDIHTGGIDHVPIHHTNEIAQNEALAGRQTVNFWLHNEFLTVDGQKMSKSLGNIYSLDDLAEQKFSPIAYRYFLLTANYRQKQNFTFEALGAAQKALDHLVSILADKTPGVPGTPGVSGSVLEKYQAQFEASITDDLNTPAALAVLWELVKSNEAPEDIIGTALNFDSILGLGLTKLIEKETKDRNSIPSEVKQLVAEREEARTSKDWQKADELRKQISKLGYSVEDTETGPRIKKI